MLRTQQSADSNMKDMNTAEVVVRSVNLTCPLGRQNISVSTHN